VLEAIVNGTILSAALTAFCWLVLRAAPRRSINAATRYGVWWMAFAVAVLLPLTWIPMPDWQDPVVPVAVSRSAAPAPEVAPVAEKQAPPSVEPPPLPALALTPVVPTDPPAFPVRIPAGDWTSWLLGALGAVSLFMLLRLAVSYARLAACRADAIAAPDRMARRVAAWLTHCGSARRGVALLLSPGISTPIAVGPRRPAILIPSRMLEGLDEAELDQIGVHEAAHLARRDDFALLLQRIVEALFAWHPVVRWIGGRIDLEREIACDDFVIAATGSRKPYAACLTRMAEIAGKAPATAAAASQTGHLSCRVDMLLDRTRHCGTRLLRSRLAAMLTLQIVLALAAVRAPLPVSLATLYAAPPLPAPAGAPAAPPAADTTPSVRDWIRASAVRLTTVEARHGFADMQPLKTMIGNARIVSLGEATHGTREFFQLKHRMLEFLATEMGFTIFSIEANMPEAYRLNEYVLEGKGDPAKLLAGMYFWTWNTEEVLDMIHWMREFNQSGKGRVQFTGFDMQTPTVAIENVREFVARRDAEYAPALANASTLAGKSQPQTANRFGILSGSLPGQIAAGKHIRYTGWIRTENVKGGYAGLWWRADNAERKILKLDNQADRGATGTSAWKQYSIDMDVPAETATIHFGALTSGSGTAWFDGLSLEIDGKPYRSDQHDFDFEGAALRGFGTGHAPWTVVLDREVGHSGSQSLRMRYGYQARFGFATATFPTQAAVGKHIRFSGWIKTEKVEDGYAGLWWRADGPDRKVLNFKNLGEGAPKGSTPWTKYALEMDVPAETVNINFGALCNGGGSAWFDGLSVEIDGKPYAGGDFDFDFEGPEVKGFSIGGAPWTVALNRESVHSGRSSLGMRRDGPAPPPAQSVSTAASSEGSKAAVSAWKEVVAHLEASRDAYRRRDAAPRDIEWAIQNARVVLQCMQGRSGEVSRDRSMAANVKWILDQNPGAKIVLWAHNGHVSTGNYRGYEPMGVDLRRVYGDQMYIFGFAFNQGSFQAVEMGKGLRNFTVPPAPGDSLDATFGSTGIPIFALDLRRAPKSGAVGTWLDSTSKSRTIGAGYSETNAAQYLAPLQPRASFDGMLFVENTSAARKNATPVARVQ
jgi:erythromycin esterase-like protein/beta-lactamase regulating signal transducer with metallopeptidase domain